MRALLAYAHCAAFMYAHALLKTKKYFRVFVTSIVIRLVNKTITHLKDFRRYYQRLNSEITQPVFF